MKTYAEKLKDPRWQRKRLEIMERDGWKCLLCGDTTKTLHVHHKEYRAGAEPWDYANDNFQTLCEECHAAEHEPARPEPPKKRLNPIVCTLIQIAILHDEFLCDIGSGFGKFTAPETEDYMLEQILWLIVFRRKKAEELASLPLFIEAMAMVQAVPISEFFDYFTLQSLCKQFRGQILTIRDRHTKSLLAEPGISTEKIMELLDDSKEITKAMRSEGFQKFNFDDLPSSTFKPKRPEWKRKLEAFE